MAKADIDLAGVLGGAAGDGAADTVTVNGTNGPDNIAVVANGGVVDVTGLATAVGISHSEAANDLLAINALDGNDDVAIGGGVAALIQTLVDLGPGRVAATSPPSDRGPRAPIVFCARHVEDDLELVREKEELDQIEESDVGVQPIWRFGTCIN